VSGHDFSRAAPSYDKNQYRSAGGWRAAPDFGAERPKIPFGKNVLISRMKRPRHYTVQIPPELRESMSLEEGTAITIQREGDHLILRPVDPIDNLRGISKGAGAIRDKEHREDRFEK
jgi:bifunctional DNA-binding transcriptional regulator/antitoxin component of YhaV-PrlF toxin-antitoxin module